MRQRSYSVAIKTSLQIIIKKKFTFRLTLRHIKYYIVASQPHHANNKNHLIVSVLAVVEV